jgi:hypothetical protein
VGAPVTNGVVVVTSCTASKVPDALDESGLPKERWAEHLYAGQQHLRLMAGVRTYRAAGQPAGPLKLRILSAFYGLLTPRQRVSSYEHTFAGMPREAIRTKADELKVPEHVRDLLGAPYRVALLLLGDHYLEACQLDATMELGGPTLAFCSPNVARRLPQLDNLRTAALSNAEARRFSCPLVGLKGELAGRALARLAGEPGELTNLTAPWADVLGWLTVAPYLDVGNAA